MTRSHAQAQSGSPSGDRAFLDLHVHTSASFDSIASPESVVRAAAARGLTHLAITDHDRIDGAIAARELAREIFPDLTVIVGQEVKTTGGDLIGAFLERPISSGLPTVEAIAEIRAQGGLVGIPHPFDRFRGSLLADELLAMVAPLVDWVEAHNARIMVGDGNEQAAAFAARPRASGGRRFRRPLGDGDRGGLPRRRRRSVLAGWTPRGTAAAWSLSAGGRRSSFGRSRRSQNSSRSSAETVGKANAR